MSRKQNTLLKLFYIGYDSPTALTYLKLGDILFVNRK